MDHRIGATEGKWDTKRDTYDTTGYYGWLKALQRTTKLTYFFSNPHPSTRWCPSKVFSEFHCKVFQGECCNQSVYVYLQSVLSVFHEKLQCHYGCTTVFALQLLLQTTAENQTRSSRKTNKQIASRSLECRLGPPPILFLESPKLLYNMFLLCFLLCCGSGWKPQR